MRGAYSIKEVLPALEPGEELEQLRKAMLEYCRLDTLGMVRILEELRTILGEVNSSIISEPNE